MQNQTTVEFGVIGDDYRQQAEQHFLRTLIESLDKFAQQDEPLESLFALDNLGALSTELEAKSSELTATVKALDKQWQAYQQSRQGKAIDLRQLFNRLFDEYKSKHQDHFPDTLSTEVADLESLMKEKADNMQKQRPGPVRTLMEQSLTYLKIARAILLAEQTVLQQQASAQLTEKKAKLTALLQDLSLDNAEAARDAHTHNQSTLSGNTLTKALSDAVSAEQAKLENVLALAKEIASDSQSSVAQPDLGPSGTNSDAEVTVDLAQVEQTLTRLGPASVGSEEASDKLTQRALCLARLLMAGQTSYRSELENLLPRLAEQVKAERHREPAAATNIHRAKNALDDGEMTVCAENLRRALNYLMPLDVVLTEQLIDEGETAAQTARGKQVVMLLGKTGAGKSTTIHFLAGSTFERKIGSEYRRPVEIRHPELKHRPVAIGQNTARSETRFIRAVPIQTGDMGATYQKHIVLCDSPGFEDTNGPEIDIANSANIVQAAGLCADIKLVALLSKTGIGNKGEGIKALAHTLGRMLGDVERHRASIFYAFTRFENNSDEQGIIRQRVKDCLDEALRQQDPDRDYVAVLRDMQVKLGGQVNIIDLDAGQPGALLDAIDNTPPITTPGSAFRTCYSGKSLAAIRQQAEICQDYIRYAVRAKNYGLIEEKLAQLERLMGILSRNLPAHAEKPEEVQLVETRRQAALQVITDALDKLSDTVTEKVKLALDDGHQVQTTEVEQLVATLTHVADLQSTLGGEASERSWENDLAQMLVTEVGRVTDSSRQAIDQVIKPQHAESRPLAQPVLPPGVLVADLPDAPAQYFTEEAVVGDGDCGFHALGINRSQLAKTLLACASDPNARDSIATEILDALVSGEFSLPDSAELDSRRQNYDTAVDARNRAAAQHVRECSLDDASEPDTEAFVQQLRDGGHEQAAQAMLAANLAVFQAEEAMRQYCAQEAVYKTYIEAYSRDLWLGHQTALLYAKQSNMSVFIWQREAQGLTLSASHDAGTAARNTFNLLHGARYTHFNLLVSADAQVEQVVRAMPEPLSAQCLQMRLDKLKLFSAQFDFLQTHYSTLQRSISTYLDKVVSHARTCLDHLDYVQLANALDKISQLKSVASHVDSQETLTFCKTMEQTLADKLKALQAEVVDILTTGQLTAAGIASINKITQTLTYFSTARYAGYVDPAVVKKSRDAVSELLQRQFAELKTGVAQQLGVIDTPEALEEIIPNLEQLRRFNKIKLLGSSAREDYSQLVRMLSESVFAMVRQLKTDLANLAEVDKSINVHRLKKQILALSGSNIFNELSMPAVDKAYISNQLDYVIDSLSYQADKIPSGQAGLGNIEKLSVILQRLNELNALDSALTPQMRERLNKTKLEVSNKLTKPCLQAAQRYDTSRVNKQQYQQQHAALLALQEKVQSAHPRILYLTSIGYQTPAQLTQALAGCRAELTALTDQIAVADQPTAELQELIASKSTIVKWMGQAGYDKKYDEEKAISDARGDKLRTKKTTVEARLAELEGQQATYQEHVAGPGDSSETAALLAAFDGATLTSVAELDQQIDDVAGKLQQFERLGNALIFEHVSFYELDKAYRYARSCQRAQVKSIESYAVQAVDKLSSYCQEYDDAVRAEVSGAFARVEAILKSPEPKLVEVQQAAHCISKRVSEITYLHSSHVDATLVATLFRSHKDPKEDWQLVYTQLTLSLQELYRHPEPAQVHKVIQMLNALLCLDACFSSDAIRQLTTKLMQDHSHELSTAGDGAVDDARRGEIRRAKAKLAQLAGQGRPHLQAQQGVEEVFDERCRELELMDTGTSSLLSPEFNLEDYAQKIKVLQQVVGEFADTLRPELIENIGRVVQRCASRMTSLLHEHADEALQKVKGYQIMNAGEDLKVLEEIFRRLQDHISTSQPQEAEASSSERQALTSSGVRVDTLFDVIYKKVAVFLTEFKAEYERRQLTELRYDTCLSKLFMGVKNDLRTNSSKVPIGYRQCFSGLETDLEQLVREKITQYLDEVRAQLPAPDQLDTYKLPAVEYCSRLPEEMRTILQPMVDREFTKIERDYVKHGQEIREVLQVRPLNIDSVAGLYTKYTDQKYAHYRRLITSELLKRLGQVIDDSLQSIRNNTYDSRELRELLGFLAECRAKLHEHCPSIDNSLFDLKRECQLVVDAGHDGIVTAVRCLCAAQAGSDWQSLAKQGAKALSDIFALAITANSTEDIRQYCMPEDFSVKLAAIDELLGERLTQLKRLLTGGKKSNGPRNMVINELQKLVAELARWDNFLKVIQQNPGCTKIFPQLFAAARGLSNTTALLQSLSQNCAKVLAPYIGQCLTPEVIGESERAKSDYFGALQQHLAYARGLLTMQKGKGDNPGELREQFQSVNTYIVQQIKQLQHRGASLAKLQRLSVETKKELQHIFETLHAIKENAPLFKAQAEDAYKQLKDSMLTSVFKKSALAKGQIKSGLTEKAHFEQIRDLLIAMKGVAMMIDLLKPEIDQEIDYVLEFLQQGKQGKKALSRLGGMLNGHKLDNGLGQLIVKDSQPLQGFLQAISGEAMGRLGHEYVLTELDGGSYDKACADIDRDALKLAYGRFHDMYTRILQHNLDEASIQENIRILISDLRQSVRQFGCRVDAQQKPHWDLGLQSEIPVLFAKVFAVWTLSNTKHYFSSVDSGQGHTSHYLLKPHAGQIYALLRMFGIGYKKGKAMQAKHSPETQSLFSSIAGGVGHLLGLGSRRQTSFTLHDNLVQIGTGEGKSVTLAAASILLGLLGVKVDVACYSQYLTQRDWEDFRQLFEDFGLRDMIHYGTFNQLCERVINHEGELRKRVASFMLGDTKAAAAKRPDNTPRVLLVDEVDVFFSDSFYGAKYSPEALVQHATLEKLADIIWSKRASQMNLAAVKLTPEYQACAAQFKQWTAVLDEGIKSMLSASRDVYKESRAGSLANDYKVEHDRIYYLEQGEYHANISYGYKTLFTYYLERDRGNISQTGLTEQIGLRVNCGAFSYAEIPRAYGSIMGVSGTLKTLSNAELTVVRDQYGIRTMTYMPSVYGKNDFSFTTDAQGVKIAEKATWYEEIVKEISARLTIPGVEDQRAVMVFFKSTDELKAFAASPQLKTADNIKDVELMLEDDATRSIDTKVAMAATSGRVTLVARRFGRGTNFVCHDEVVKLNGGAHVIQTFLSPEVSEEVQIRGRTARQGGKGSYSLVLCAEDLDYFQFDSQDVQRICAQTDRFEPLHQRRLEQFEALYLNKIKCIVSTHAIHAATMKFVGALNRSDTKTMRRFLLIHNAGPAEQMKSRTVCLMDATGSMSSLLSHAKDSVATMYQRAREVLSEHGMAGDIFQIQFVVYRNYNVKAEQLLQASPWCVNPAALNQFMRGIEPAGGWGPEAVEIGLWHVNQECKRGQVTQVLLIGDAPAQSASDVTYKRGHQYGESYWQTTKFAQPTDWQREMQGIVSQGIPVFSFYVKNSAKSNFEEIAKRTNGTAQKLDVNSAKGAQLLTDTVTKAILANIASGDVQLEAQLKATYEKRYS